MALLVVLVTLPILVVTFSVKMCSAEDRKLAAYFRGIVADNMKKDKEEAVSKIKTAWQVYKEQRKIDRAAVLIQDACTVYLAQKERHKAAKLIQGACRTYKSQKKRNDKASVIKNACRVYRKQKKRDQSARVIQKAGLVFLSQRDAHEKKAVNIIKQAFKTYKAQKKQAEKEASEDYGLIEMDDIPIFKEACR